MYVLICYDPICITFFMLLFSLPLQYTPNTILPHHTIVAITMTIIGKDYLNLLNIIKHNNVNVIRTCSIFRYYLITYGNCLNTCRCQSKYIL